MILSKKLKVYVEDAKASDSYWVESAKLDFALILEQQRRRAQVSYANLAKKIGTSAAYISKVFRGDSNLTIESMVKLARATGGQLEIRVVDIASVAPIWTGIAPSTRTATTSAASTTIVPISDYAANHDTYSIFEAA